MPTASDYSAQLKELNKDYERRRVWSSLYGAVDLSKQRALNTLRYDYGKDISEAYAAAYNQAGVIANSTLGQGYKDAAYLDLDASLSEAFESYKANYLKNKLAIEEDASKATSEIDTALNTQATNIASYQRKPYEYLTYLYERATGSGDYELDDKLSELFTSNPNWSKYIVKDENDVSRLMTESELYSTVYDKDGNLTVAGADYYDQMLNSLSSELGSDYSFHNWLSTNDEKLYNWSQTYNPYDYAPDMLGNNTNISSVRTMFGLSSTDEKYQFIERMGGFSEKQLTDMFNKYTESAKSFINNSNEASGRYTKDIVKDISSMVTDVKSIADELGITSDIEAELGMSFEQLSTAMTNYYKSSETNWDIWWKGMLNTAMSAGAGAGAGSTIGAHIGGIGAIPGVIVGAIGGAIGGIISGVKNTSNTKKSNRELLEQASQAYEDLTVVLVNYAQKKRRDAEIMHSNNK